MSDDLEALAAKGRAADEVRELEREVDEQWRAKRGEMLADETLQTTLREVHRKPLPLIIAALAVGGGTIAGVALALEQALIILGVGGALLIGLALAYKGMGPRAVAAGISWIESIPFRFDKRGYLEVLSGTRNGTHLELQITFREEPSESDRALYSEACAGVAEVEARQWKGRRLILRSGRLHSFWSETETRASYFTNAIPHAWVMSLIDKVVRSLHDRGVVDRAEVRVV